MAGEKDSAIDDLIERWHRTERRWHDHGDNFPSEEAFVAANRQYCALLARISAAEKVTIADLPRGRVVSNEDRY